MLLWFFSYNLVQLCLLLKYCCLYILNSGQSATIYFIVKGATHCSQYGGGLCSIRCPCVRRAACPMRTWPYLLLSFVFCFLTVASLLFSFILLNLLLPTLFQPCSYFCLISFFYNRVTIFMWVVNICNLALRLSYWNIFFNVDVNWNKKVEIEPKW